MASQTIGTDTDIDSADSFDLSGRGPRKVPSLFDYQTTALSETILTTIVALLVLVLVYSFMVPGVHPMVPAAALTGLIVVAFAVIRYTLSPDRLRAAQTKRTLALASQSLEYMRGGLSIENCQEVCNILLPETQAMAVAITDDKNVLGYAGRHSEHFPVGGPIHTQATHRVLTSQKAEVFETSAPFGAASSPAKVDGIRTRTTSRTRAVKRWKQDIDAADSNHETVSLIPAGIVAPLIVRGQSVGTLKLYYEAPHLIDETQIAIGEGLAQLLSTQLAIAELDRQVELATKAELQALQSQINPHFLFNTINTIASLTRTDPMRARELLREFAVFYRQTLENSNDLIPLEREVAQTLRYLNFEIARFGESRIRSEVTIEEGLEDVPVPGFVIQPIVENSVNHAMPPEGTLVIGINVRSEGDDVIIEVSDNGTGMTDEQARKLLQEAGPSEAGTGIALRNIDGRLRVCFEMASGVEVRSEPGQGTCVTLLLAGALSDE